MPHARPIWCGVTWIRDTGEPVERRRTDVARLAIAAVATTIVGMWAQTQSTRRPQPLPRRQRRRPTSLEGVAKVGVRAGLDLGGARRRRRACSRSARSRWRGESRSTGAAAWGIAELLNDVLGTHSVARAGRHVRLGDGPAIPVPPTSPSSGGLNRGPVPVRRCGRSGGSLPGDPRGRARHHVPGRGFPSDVLGGLLLGVAVAALVTRCSVRRPADCRSAEVRAALTELGNEVAVRSSSPTFTIPRASVMDATLDTGDRSGSTRTVAISVTRDLRPPVAPSDVPRARPRRVREPDSSRWNTSATRSMLAERAGVHAPRSCAPASAAPKPRSSSTTPPTGTPLADVDAERVTDDVLSARCDLARGHRRCTRRASATATSIRSACSWPTTARGRARRLRQRRRRRRVVLARP